MKKLFSKKSLSLLLALAMVVALFAGMSFGASATYSGNWSSYYDTTWYDSSATSLTIYDAADLAAFAYKVNSGTDFAGVTITLNNDIDLDGHYWTPIGNANITSDTTTYSPKPGTSPKGFAGTFNGNGKTIENMYVNITSSTKTGVGLFGYTTYTGVVKNFTLKGTVSVGSTLEIDAVAGVVGYNSGTIENVINCAGVTADKAYNVGGIAGFNNNYYGTNHTGSISMCGNEGAVRGGSKIGGIVGENAGSIAKCYNYATIYNASGARAGTGGIAGRNGNNNSPYEVGTIANCYNRGYINNNNGYWGGGIAGFQSAGCSVTKCYDTGNVYNCSWSNPLIGKNEGTFDYNNCYYKNGLNHSGSGASELGTGMDLEDMQTQDFADTLNGGNSIWEYASSLNNELPYLEWQGTGFSDDAATDDVSGSPPSASWGNNSGTIILNGRFASDGVTNGSKTGYKTLSAALTAAGSSGTIYVTGPVPITSSVSISNNVTIIRDSAFTDGYLFEIGNGGALSMSAGTINGNGLYANAQIMVLSGGTFTMSGGTITNAYGKYLPGAGVRVYGGTFNLSGGTLSSLSGTGTYTQGSAVTVSSGSFKMTSGTISGNTAPTNGGIVYVNPGATFEYAGSGIASTQVVYLANTSGNSDAYITLTSALTGYLTVECAHLSTGAYGTGTNVAQGANSTIISSTTLGYFVYNGATHSFARTTSGTPRYIYVAS